MRLVNQLISLFFTLFKPLSGDDFPVVAALRVECFFLPDVFRDIIAHIPGLDFHNPFFHFLILELIPKLRFTESSKLHWPEAAKEEDKGARLDSKPCCPLCLILPKDSVNSKHINQTHLPNIKPSAHHCW